MSISSASVIAGIMNLTLKALQLISVMSTQNVPFLMFIHHSVTAFCGTIPRRDFVSFQITAPVGAVTAVPLWILL